ncbi:hypothetical protein K438DRAFT_1768934 [Mycena galopus ATCC 62051]|nr:hypothetical protein K438DRAFT_1768934 [Mycena galopus ATCC 62051]
MKTDTSELNVESELHTTLAPIDSIHRIEAAELRGVYERRRVPTESASAKIISKGALIGIPCVLPSEQKGVKFWCCYERRMIFKYSRNHDFLTVISGVAHSENFGLNFPDVPTTWEQAQRRFRGRLSYNFFKYCKTNNLA